MRVKNQSSYCGSVESTRLMTIPGPLQKCCNKSFRTCAKVRYKTCGVVFPQTRSFPLYIEEAGNHTGGCLECDIVSCV